MDAIVTVRRASGVAVAVLHGDHDLGNAPALHAELLEVLRSRPTGIVLDFSDVTFCDLAALRTLAGFGRRASAVGVWVRTAGPSAIVRRLLEVTGLCTSLPIYPDVELALRGARTRVGSAKTGRRVGSVSTSDTKISGQPSEIFAAPGKADV